MRRLEDIGDRELIEMAKGLFDAIYNIECFSARDVELLYVILEELKRRGYSVEKKCELVIE